MRAGPREGRCAVVLCFVRVEGGFAAGDTPALRSV